MNNVGPNDLAILVHPKFPENKDRICTVKEAWIPKPELGLSDCQWWICEFTSPVKVVIEGSCVEYGEIGYFSFATLRDSQLRRIADLSDDVSKRINEELTTEFDWYSPITSIQAITES